MYCNNLNAAIKKVAKLRKKVTEGKIYTTA